MKTLLKSKFIMPSLLIAGLGLLLPGWASSQTFTNLYSFTAASAYPYTNSDGAGPVAGLVLSGNTLYGTAEFGGKAAQGTVFGVQADGKGSFTNLHVFSAIPSPYFTNGDGANPRAVLIISGNTLYGTAQAGGASDNGTVFRVNTNGTDFTNLHSFTFASQDSSASYISYTNGDGAGPVAGLVLAGNTLYGTTPIGGSAGLGTVFAIHADGTGGFTNLHSFTATVGALSTNGDGAGPVAGLVLSGNTLYGTARIGGASGNGTVFRLNADGTGGFTNLHNFPATTSSFPHSNGEGANPAAALVLAGDILYGTARNGGAWGYGTVFAIRTDGMSFTNLHDFSGPPSDGANPAAGLVLAGDTLYGTTLGGGGSDSGLVFAIKTNGMDFAILYQFTANPGPAHTNSDGVSPAGLILAGNTLYGTATEGGAFGGGTVFGLSLPMPPQLSITRSGASVIVTWPANATGFSLEFATNLVPPVVWNSNLPASVTVNGNSTVTNPISGSRKFYRLIQ